MNIPMKYIKLLAVIATLFALIGCEEKEKEEPFVSASPSSLTFSVGGETQTIKISSNQTWTVSADEAWLSVSPSSGSGDMSVTVTAQENTSFDGRSAKINVSATGAASSVSATQVGVSRVLNVIDGIVTVPEAGGSYQIGIEYNVDYTVSSDVDWIKFVGTKAVSSGKLEFEVSANKTIEKRVGKVTISDKSGKATAQTITFTQDPFVGILELSGSTVEVPEEGGTYTLDIEYNVDYKVTVEESAADWIKFIESKATSTGKLEFFVEANNKAETRSGKVTISDPSGAAKAQTITFTQAASMHEKNALMQIYNDMGGSSAWTNWGTDAPLSNWCGITFEDGHVTGFNAAMIIPRPYGNISEGISELSELRVLTISSCEEVTGTLPESLAKLTKLERFTLQDTKLTGPLPDIFGEMKNLKEVKINMNWNLGGPLPESLGTGSELEILNLRNNAFTGSIPASWFEKEKELDLFNNKLSGQIPVKFYSWKNWHRIFYQILSQDNDSSHLDHSNAPYVPFDADSNRYVGYDGSEFVIDDLIKQNEYTIIAHWGISNPFGDQFMKQLKTLYDRYHSKGVEIVTFNSWDINSDSVSEAQVKKYLQDNGFESMKNVNIFKSPAFSYPLENPYAEVVDKRGAIVFSCNGKEFFDKDDVFGKNAVLDLPRFIRTVYGEFDPDHVSTDFSKDGEVTVLQKASVGNGIDIVLMGEAYVDTDMAEGGVYDTVMRDAMEEFFKIEPYKSYRDRFNVYEVKVVSKNCIIGEDTAFGVQYGAGTSVYGNYEKAMDYALKVPGVQLKNLVVIAMINSDHGGATTSSSPGYDNGLAWVSAYGNSPNLYGPIVRHEAAGHAFAHLDDEYVSSDFTPDAGWHAKKAEQQNELGWWPNLYITTGDATPENCPWKEFLDDARYKDSVGIYAGGGASASKYVYRPSPDSMMNTNVEYFNAPSRYAIFKRIMKLSGEDCSFEKFATYDAINR